MTAPVACWSTDDGVQRAWYFSIRHRVFVEEQRIMSLTDVDMWDCDPGTGHVLASHGDTVAGTVRIYRHGGADGRRWKGDRLAVLKPHRASLVGARLVQFAVATAAARGGDVMDAHVQVQNVHFFERLGWSLDGPPVPYFGVPHQPMVFDLATAADLDISQVPADPRLELPAPRQNPSSLLAAAVAT